MWNRKTLIGTSIALGLVAICVISRMASRDGALPPNVSAVAAAALFAGFIFRRNLWLAIGVPLAAMLLSDAVIGGYDWREMIVVYAALCAPVVLGLWISKSKSFGARAVMVPLSSIASSTIFFITTNAAVWAFSAMYAKSASGLLDCYISALPFFRYTVMGDLAFSTAIFGVAAAAYALTPAHRDAPATITA